MNMEPPQDIIVEEDEGPVSSHQETVNTQQILLNRKEANTVKYQKQYQTNPFGKKLKEVSSISHHNIEETALIKDLELHEKKQPLHIKKPSASSRVKLNDSNKSAIPDNSSYMIALQSAKLYEASQPKTDV